MWGIGLKKKVTIEPSNAPHLTWKFVHQMDGKEVGSGSFSFVRIFVWLSAIFCLNKNITGVVIKHQMRELMLYFAQT